MIDETIIDEAVETYNDYKRLVDQVAVAHASEAAIRFQMQGNIEHAHAQYFYFYDEMYRDDAFIEAFEKGIQIDLRAYARSNIEVVKKVDKPELSPKETSEV